MTTKLQGGDTVFLPFNQGNDGHEGNPPSAHRLVDELPVARDPRPPDVHAHPQGLRALRAGQVRQEGRRAARLPALPPAARRRAGGRRHRGARPGKRYLVWHSAGSGKTKTIAWLSHRLIRHMSADSKSTFDSVIVVTDRTVLDENIRDDMNLVQSSKGLVVAVGEKSGAKSPQLKKALARGRPHHHLHPADLPRGHEAHRGHRRSCAAGAGPSSPTRRTPRSRAPRPGSSRSCSSTSSSTRTRTTSAPTTCSQAKDSAIAASATSPSSR